MIEAALPWHEPLWRQFSQTQRDAKLHHALLLAGPPGVGKAAFARRLAQALHCQSDVRELSVCGECRLCQLSKAGHAPDIVVTHPLEDRQTISIDQVRELVHNAGLTAHSSPFKVVIVEPAEALTRPASNALLKTLEEPPLGTHFLLVSHQPALLLPTIRSRCQFIRFQVPERAMTTRWLAKELPDADDGRINAYLAAARWAPFVALALANAEQEFTVDAVLDDLRSLSANRQDPVSIAEAWRPYGVRAVAEKLATVFGDVLRTQCATDAELIHPTQRETLQRLANAVDFNAGFKVIDHCTEISRGLATLNLNEQLVLETLATTVYGVVRAARKSNPKTHESIHILGSPIKGQDRKTTRRLEDK